MRLLKSKQTPLALAEIERSLERTKSLVFRVLRELERQELVRRDGDGRYWLGIEALEVGAAYLMHSDFTATVRRVLQAAATATRENVNLSVLRGGDVLYLMKIPGPDSYVTISRVGGRVPAHCVASGKALLAELPSEEIRSLLHEPLATMTPHSPATVRALESELDLVRELGYAIDEEQAVLGRCGLALTVKLDTGESASISLSTHAAVFPDRRSELLDVLLSVKDEIGRELAARESLAG